MIAPSDPSPAAVVPAISARDRAALSALVRDALDALTLRRDEIAGRLDTKPGTLDAYRYGLRRPPDDVRRRLAVVLNAHADALREIAGELLAVDVARRLDADT